MARKRLEPVRVDGGEPSTNELVGLLTSIFQEVRGRVTVPALEGKAELAFQEFQRIKAGLALTQPAAVTTFTANPNPIDAGQSTTLSWTTTNSKTVSIDNGIGTQPSPGSIDVTLTATTTFTATATGSCTESPPVQVTVTVNDGGVDVELSQSFPR